MTAAPLYTDFTIGHASLQFSDTPSQWRHDTAKVFSRQADWIGGTEAGETDNWTILRQAAIKAGYVIRRYKSNWIAVNKKLIRRKTAVIWSTKTVIDNDLVHGPGHDTSYIVATWFHPKKYIGKLSHVVSHYPTKGKPEATDPAYRINLRHTKTIAKAVWTRMVSLGTGAALATYSGDQNINDKLSDTFFGGPIVTAGDETKMWPSTGHGPIDVIARYKRDTRTRFVKWVVFNDKKFFLHSDHYYTEAVYRVKHLALAA